MSAILPLDPSAVTCEPQAAETGRTEQHSPRFSAAQLAEVEARYAQLLATDAPGEFALSEPTVTTIGTPGMDQIEAETEIAMLGAPGGRQFLLTLRLGSEVLELTPSKAREAAEALCGVVAGLIHLAADA